LLYQPRGERKVRGQEADPGDIQGAAEGVYFFENFPRMLAHKNDEYHKEFNKLIGIDDVYGREIGGTRVMDKSHGWQAWEDIFAVKQAVEASGYKIRKDMEGVIQTLEGRKFEVKKRIPKEELAANMPLRHNLSTLPV
jgi:branched-chain amino acid transport system substrate-binding protein